MRAHIYTVKNVDPPLKYVYINDGRPKMLDTNNILKFYIGLIYLYQTDFF